MDNRFNLVILGGGCAGLSLAMRLADAGATAPSTLILEKNAHYSNDRTWCFWDEENPLLKNWVDHVWTSFEIINGATTVTKSCAENRYLMLSAQTFYEQATAKIASNKQRLTLLNQQEIIEVIKTQNQSWKVVTNSDIYTADQIIDTRPYSQTQDDDALMWQTFIGYEVETSTDVFNSSTFTLMDFDASFSQGLGFIYVLPFSPNRALIEYTVFSDKSMSTDNLKEKMKPALLKYLKKVDYQVLRTEYGKLPMGNQKIKYSDDPSYIYAGLYAGSARPSSGYAFQRIQRWATECVQGLISHQSLIAPKKDKLILALMDDIFLNVLKSNPQSSITIFFNFFAKCNAITVIRFLSDQAKLTDYVSIIGSMPKLLFLKELPSYFFKRFIKAFK